MGRNSFDGRMIGLNGEIVIYPKWFFLLLHNAQRTLDRKAKESGKDPIKIIIRDKATGLFVVLESVRDQLRPFLDLPDYRLHDLKSSDPFFISGKARISGKKGLTDLLELGIRRRKDVDD